VLQQHRSSLRAGWAGWDRNWGSRGRGTHRDGGDGKLTFAFRYVRWLTWDTICQRAKQTANNDFSLPNDVEVRVSCSSKESKDGLYAIFIVGDARPRVARMSATFCV
jgi:hypothetical protein